MYVQNHAPSCAAGPREQRCLRRLHPYDRVIGHPKLPQTQARRREARRSRRRRRGNDGRTAPPSYGRPSPEGLPPSSLLSKPRGPGSRPRLWDPRRNERRGRGGRTNRLREEPVRRGKGGWPTHVMCVTVPSAFAGRGRRPDSPCPWWSYAYTEKPLKRAGRRGDRGWARVFLVEETSTARLGRRKGSSGFPWCPTRLSHARGWVSGKEVGVGSYKRTKESKA